MIKLFPEKQFWKSPGCSLIFFPLVFLLACFSCSKKTAPVNGAGHEPAAAGEPYTWEKKGDTWNITLNGDHTFPLDKPWSLYLHYSWDGREDELPLELSVLGSLPENNNTGNREKTEYYFFPKTVTGRPQGYTETFLVFHREQWEALPLEIAINTGQGGGLLVTCVKLEPRLRDSQPLPADPGTMMNCPPSSWRYEVYEIFSHNLYPGMLYLVSGSFAAQSQFLKRLAFFTEKHGFTGRLAEDDEIADLRDWFAHDYRAGDLADFYDLARKQGFPLNDSELLLRDLLLNHGIINYEMGSFTEGKGALLGFSPESEDRLPVYYVHESVHGLEFTIPELQQIFLDFFEKLSWAEKVFLRDALYYRGYNVFADKQLLASETAAYLLQQSPGETDEYFKEYILAWYVAYHRKIDAAAGTPAEGISEESDEAPKPYSDSITAFLASNPGIFGRRSAALEKEFQALTGLSAHNFYDLLPKGSGILPKESNL
jgi:hypothetical protein